MASLDPPACDSPQSDRDEVIEAGREVILQEAAALSFLAASLDATFLRAVDLMLSTQARVIVSGVGKSGHVGRKIAATLAGTGTLSFFLHASEAAHGDLGMIMPGDTLLLLSNSGYSRELRPLMAYARRLGVPMIALVSKMDSPLARAADIVLRLPPAQEACPARIAPTTSTTMMLALGDALAIAAMRRRGLTRNELALWHPGGEIGSRIAPIEEVIDRDAPLPLVRAEAPMRDVVFEMTSGGKGAAGVVDEHGALVGIITDGDVRRSFDQVLTARARDVMTPRPLTARCGTSVEEVLATMTARKITVMFVIDAGRPIGLAHIHDLAP